VDERLHRPRHVVRLAVPHQAVVGVELRNTMSTHIADIRAREILDSRGNPTVEAEVLLAGGGFGRAAVPSGASTGALEAMSFGTAETATAGRGFRGRSTTSRHHRTCTGRTRRHPAGTHRPDHARPRRHPNKANRSAPTPSWRSRWRWPGRRPPRSVSRCSAIWVVPTARVLPVPCLNVLNGGAHAANSVDIQEFMLVPGGFGTFRKRSEPESRSTTLSRRSWPGAGSPPTSATRAGSLPTSPPTGPHSTCWSEAIEAAGYELGEQIALALDVAATEIWREGKLRAGREGRDSGRDGRLHRRTRRRVPARLGRRRHGRGRLGRLEEAQRRLGSKGPAGGRRPVRHQPGDPRTGIREKAANAILIKVNQIGSLSETLHTMETAERASFGRMVSHRSGETEDSVHLPPGRRHQRRPDQDRRPRPRGAHRQVQPVAADRRGTGRPGPLRRLGYLPEAAVRLIKRPGRRPLHPRPVGGGGGGATNALAAIARSSISSRRWRAAAELDALQEENAILTDRATPCRLRSRSNAWPARSSGMCAREKRRTW
jgi:enolase